MHSHKTFIQQWADIEATEDPAHFIRFIDRNGSGDSDTLADLEGPIALLGLRDGKHVLEVGCGAGGSVRAFARAVAPSGRAVGVDLSETMIREAQKRASERGIAAQFAVGDAAKTGFSPDIFDACYAAGLFEILPKPLEVLCEMARVTKPGGIVLVGSHDFGMTAINSGNRRLTRRLLEYISDVEMNGWIGRQMPGLYRSAGLRQVRTTLLTYREVYAKLTQDLQEGGFLDRACAAGVAEKDEVDAWLAELAKLDSTGAFFCSVTWCTTTGVK